MAELRVDNTRVCVRLRKSIQSSKSPENEQKKCLIVDSSETEVTVFTNVGEYPFVCDRVFAEETPQIDVFRYCGLPLLEDVLAGYNATMIAYGQTGSGKTYTMTGDTRYGSQYGIVPRSMQMLFDTAETKASTIDFTLSISFVEVYMDKVFDLLQFAPLTGAGSPVNPTTITSSSSIKTTNRNHPSSQYSTTSSSSSSTTRKVKSPTIFNTTSSTEKGVLSISERNVYTFAEFMACYRAGIANRMTSTTRMNSSSSRSHSIFTVYVSQTLKKGNTNDSQRVPSSNSNSSNNNNTNNKHEIHPSIYSSEASWFRVTSAKLVLVDLAGSELVGKSSLAGQQLEEAKTINKSLSALGQVISALTVSNPQGLLSPHPLSISKGLMGATIPTPRAHVPYRNSKLTYLLRDCIGGTSRMVLIVNVSSAHINANETLSSLRFGLKAKNVQNRVAKNIVSLVHLPPPILSMKILEEEILMDRMSDHEQKSDCQHEKIQDINDTVSLLNGSGPVSIPFPISTTSNTVMMLSSPGSTKRSSIQRNSPFVTAGERGDRDSRVSMSMTFPGVVSPGLQATIRRTEQRLEEQSVQLADLTQRLTSIQSAHTLSHYLQDSGGGSMASGGGIMASGGGIMESATIGEYDMDDSFLMISSEEKKEKGVDGILSTTATNERTMNGVSMSHNNSSHGSKNNKHHSSSSSNNHNNHHSNNHNNNPMNLGHQHNDNRIDVFRGNHERMKDNDTMIEEANGEDEAKENEIFRNGRVQGVDQSQGGHHSRQKERGSRLMIERNDLEGEINPLSLEHVQNPADDDMTGELSRASQAATMAMVTAQNAIYGSSSNIMPNSNLHHLLIEEGDGEGDGEDGNDDDGDDDNIVGLNGDGGDNDGGVGVAERHGSNVFVDITEIYSMVDGNNHQNHSNNHNNNHNRHNRNHNAFPYELSPHRAAAGEGGEMELGGDGSAPSSPYSLSRPQRHHPSHPHLHPHDEESFSSVNPLHRRQPSSHLTHDGKPINHITTPSSTFKSTRLLSTRSQYREPVYQGKRRAIGNNGNLASSFLMSTHDSYDVMTQSGPQHQVTISRLSKQLADETIQVLTMTRLLNEERKTVVTLSQDVKEWQTRMDQKGITHAHDISVWKETVQQLQQELATEHAQNEFLSSQLRQQRDLVRDLTYQLQQQQQSQQQQPQQQQQQPQQRHAQHPHAYQPPFPPLPPQQSPSLRRQSAPSQPRTESGLSSPVRIQPYPISSPGSESLSVVPRHARTIVEDTPYSPVLTDYLRTESTQTATIVEQEVEVSFASAGSEDMISNLHVPLLPLHETFSWNDSLRPIPFPVMLDVDVNISNRNNDNGNGSEEKERKEIESGVVGSDGRGKANDGVEGSEQAKNCDMNPTQPIPQQQPQQLQQQQPPPPSQQPSTPSPHFQQHNHGMNIDQPIIHGLSVPNTVPPSSNKEKNWTKRKTTSFATTFPITPMATSVMEESLTATTITISSATTSEKDFIPPPPPSTGSSV